MEGARIKSDSYYVYAHSSKGKVFYVGMGKGGRAFEFAPLLRGLKWNTHVKSVQNFEAHILKEFPTRIEALAYELAEIKRLQPIGNTIGTTLAIRRKATTPNMDASEMGKRGAKITNKLLTPEKRAKAARKGWRIRKARLKDKVKTQ